ncbi:MAG: hypothetical protein H8K03_01690 [Nitrospira sp.]|nr:hypothetical protein [Nitrospira sp. BO4]
MPQIHVKDSISLCIRRSLRFGAVAPIVLLMLGCATVAKVTNLSDEPCKASFSRQLSSVLKAEGEKPEAADALATKTVSTLTTYDLGPRPFAIAAPSGTDYRFFVDRKGTDCVLTLYGRRKGFVSYTNNLTYIATEPLPDCTCAD